MADHWLLEAECIHGKVWHDCAECPSPDVDPAAAPTIRIGPGSYLIHVNNDASFLISPVESLPPPDVVAKQGVFRIYIEPGEDHG